jgi:hypothetical protein
MIPVRSPVYRPTITLISFNVQLLIRTYLVLRKTLRRRLRFGFHRRRR